MNLPDLPKQNKHKEADFGIALRRWIEEYKIMPSSLETKHTRGKNYLPFSEITPKQIAYANKISSDEGVLIRVQGTDGEPDYVYMRNQPAYIVIRYPDFFAVITIGNLLFERDRYKKKSLTADRAKEIASFIK